MPAARAAIIGAMGALDGWRFCPRDAGELVHEPDHLRCPVCGERYWANSVPGAQVVLERDGRVLLGRRLNEPGAGRWDLPGGFLHEGEDALAGLRREVREETGLELEPVEILGTWNEDYFDRVVLCLTWLARPVGGEERAGDDPVELRGFPSHGPPPGSEPAFPAFEE